MGESRRMTEKELKQKAEDYTNNKLVNLEDFDAYESAYFRFEQGVFDGYIDGYNASLTELKEQGLALQSDMDKTIEQNIALKKELNKANEWHFTHRNEKHQVIDCPKGEENKLYLLLLNSRDSKEYEFGRKVPVVCYWNEEWCRFERLEHTIGERNVNQNNINAWKEIELPKEIKENDYKRI